MLGSRKAARRSRIGRGCAALGLSGGLLVLAAVVALGTTAVGCQEGARQEHLRAGRQAMAKGEWDRAIASFTSALALLDENETGERTRIESQIAEAKYQTLLAAAKERLNQPDYEEALRAYSPPRPRALDTREVQLPISEINYRRYLGQGKSYLQSKRPREALSVFRMAQRAKDTVEVQGWIAMAEEARRAQEKQEKE
ncbi:MAG: hypothetical protein AMS14_03185 [Planctomycetes bacterium DG_20]|nr:MAG: hypothetical protein AMS14_03185 [Planctomycetes bacterium DG_20]